MASRAIFSKLPCSGWSSNMSEVKPIAFANANGKMLFGTLHVPAAHDPRVPAVLLLSPGVKMRVGPGRLYVPLTDALVARGHMVLRFDFYGLGDSEGELQETMLADVYNNIEVGRYVDDTLCALQWLREKCAAKRFILGGLCGGAITAILAAQRDASVEGLLSIGMTVTLASNAATPGKFLTNTEIEGRRRAYFQKLLQPKSWLRLLTFRSDYDVIWQSLKRMFVKEKPRAVADLSTAPGTVPTEQRGNANPLFPLAFLAFLQRGGKALMLFSEKDRLYGEYEEKFALPFAAKLAPYLPQIEKHVIPNANHVVSLAEWRTTMLALSEQWLQRSSLSASKSA
jgi:pimeloyl-ACP methyl ester carboxylesterase